MSSEKNISKQQIEDAIQQLNKEEKKVTNQVLADMFNMTRQCMNLKLKHFKLNSYFRTSNVVTALKDVDTSKKTIAELVEIIKRRKFIPNPDRITILSVKTELTKRNIPFKAVVRLTRADTVKFLKELDSENYTMAELFKLCSDKKLKYATVFRSFASFLKEEGIEYKRINKK